MPGLLASVAALAAVRELATAYRLQRPVLLLFRQDPGVDFVRGKNGELVRGAGGGDWRAIVQDRADLVALPLQPISWNGLELLCEEPREAKKQLHLEVIDGELHVQERDI